MRKILLFACMLATAILSSQENPVKSTPVNEQFRFRSESRQFYMWNPDKDGYDLKDTEFENSLIDIREINSKSNGYVVISMSDNGSVRTFHGSLAAYNLDAEGNSTWILRSKNARGKMVLEPKKKTITYSYEANPERYLKIFVFNIASDEPGTD